MRVSLTDTTASQIAAALHDCRARIGASGSGGMVLTIIIVTESDHQRDALEQANAAAQEHPARVLVVSYNRSRRSRLDAEVVVAENDSTGESVLLTFHGAVRRHSQSVVMPLLLPDSPVVIWWPDTAPSDMHEDQLGALADRRIADTWQSKRPLAALRRVSENYTPGDTDMAWTRLTPWRTLLAAALDQHPGTVKAAAVEAEANNASARLLAAWLAQRLRVPVSLRQSEGPGITATRLTMGDGEVSITRPDGRLAEYAIPGQPTRHVALKRRTTSDLLREELLRLDPDDVYADVVKEFLRQLDADRDAQPRAGRAPKVPTPPRRPPGRKAAKPTTAKKTATKKAATKKAATKKAATKKAPARKRATRARRRSR